MKKIKIKSVSFRANMPLDNRYNHVHIEATADVPAGERPEAVIDQLKLFVAAELKRAKGEEVRTVSPGKFRV
jgi:hypothetical protein